MATVKDQNGLTRLACDSCGKSVSSGFTPDPTDTPDKGLIVRALIECPECIEQPARDALKAAGRRS
jgi:hypothetical protein